MDWKTRCGSECIERFLNMFLLPRTLFIPRRLRHLQQIDTFVFALSGLCQHILVYFIDILSIDRLLQVMHLFRLAKRSMRSNFQPLFFFFSPFSSFSSELLAERVWIRKPTPPYFCFLPSFLKFLFFSLKNTQADTDTSTSSNPSYLSYLLRTALYAGSKEVFCVVCQASDQWYVRFSSSILRQSSSSSCMTLLWGVGNHLWGYGDLSPSMTSMNIFIYFPSEFLSSHNFGVWWALCCFQPALLTPPALQG